MSPSEMTGGSGRQHIPYAFQSRNHGLFASFSSCVRLTAERSLGRRGRVSGNAEMLF
jgi:hypothetical protein